MTSHSDMHHWPYEELCTEHVYCHVCESDTLYMLTDEMQTVANSVVVIFTFSVRESRHVYKMLLYFSFSFHAELGISRSVLKRPLVINTHNTISKTPCLVTGHSLNPTFCPGLKTYVNSSFIFLVTSHWRHILSSGNSYLRAVLCMIAVKRLWGLKNPASHTEDGNWNKKFLYR